MTQLFTFTIDDTGHQTSNIVDTPGRSWHMTAEEIALTTISAWYARNWLEHQLTECENGHYGPDDLDEEATASAAASLRADIEQFLALSHRMLARLEGRPAPPFPPGRQAHLFASHRNLLKPGEETSPPATTKTTNTNGARGMTPDRRSKETS